MISIRKKLLTNIIYMVVIVFFALLVLFLLFFDKRHNSSNISGVEIEKGIQYIDITAKAGYFPRIIEAQNGIETKLRVITQNSFDCSLALRIPSLGISNNLPATGETVIPLGVFKKGDVLEGTCSMGMYGFKINFK